MAGSSIGNLSIVISGNASGLTAALTSAQKQLSDFNKKVAASAMAANGLGGYAPATPKQSGLSKQQTDRVLKDLQYAQKYLANKFPHVPPLAPPPPAPGMLSRTLSSLTTVGKAAVSSSRNTGSLAGAAFKGGWDTARAGWNIGNQIKDGLGVAVGFAATAGAAVKHSLEKAMDFQDLLVSFEVMTGSATQGRQMLETLERFSATLPFTQGSVMKAARTLAGNGVELKNVIPALRGIATVVAGTGGDDERFGNMVLAFSQVTSMGKLMGQELRQLNDAGFTVDNLAKAMGVGAGEVRKLMEEGAISTQDVYRAFNMATGAGGKFFGLLDRQAETTRGRIRRLSSEMSIAERKVGEGFRQAIDNSGALEFGLGALRTLDAYIPTIQSSLANAGNGLEETFVRIAAIAGSIADQFTPVANGLSQTVVKPLVQLGVMAHGAMHGSGGGGLRGYLGVAAEMLTTPALMSIGKLFPGGTGNKTPFATPEGQALVDSIAAGQVSTGGGRAEAWAKSMQEKLNWLKGMRYAGQIADVAGMGMGLSIGAGFNMNVVGVVEDGLLQLREPTWKLSDDLEALRKKIADTAKDGFTPLDKFTKTMAQINQLATTPIGGPRVGGALGAAVGFGAVGVPNQIGQMQQNMAMREQFLQLEGSLDKFKDEFPKAMERGSVDAASAINRELYKTGAEDVQSRILRVLEQQKVDQARILKEAEEMGRFFRANPGMNLK